MIEFFETLSSFWDKVTTFCSTLVDTVTDAVAELQVWISYLPVGLISAASIIVVLLVIFRILGR